MLLGLFTSLALGFGYFIAAVPSGVALGVPITLAVFAAWVGYTLGAILVVLVGAPLRAYAVRRFHLKLERDDSKLIWRIWGRFGLLGFALLAPVTLGPQIGGLLVLGLGEKPLPVFVNLSLGALPWAILFGYLTAAGAQLVK